MIRKGHQELTLNETVGTHCLIIPSFWSLMLLALIAPLSHAQPVQPVPERVESVTLPASASDDGSPVKLRDASAAPRPHSISIGYVSQAKASVETNTAPQPGTPRKIGFGRDIAELAGTADTAARLTWQTTPQGGTIAALSITSPLAMGLRLGILVRRLPAEAILRFYRQGAGTAHEISGREILETLKRNLDAGDTSDEARTFWSPHVEGEEATLEIELPMGISPDALEIAIPRVSHFFSSPLAAPGGAIEKIGQAASCEIDVSCYSSTWSNESNATAMMTFVDSGSGYACTGTLLNNKASNFTPYFLSANHCISSQTVASTLYTYWFDRSAACNSSVPNPVQIRTDGATLLYASSVTDTSFMQLRSTPPSGVSYAGWLTSASSLGTPVTGIDHPLGGLQKISFGSLQSYQDCSASIAGSFSCSTASQATGEFLNAVYTLGTTEAGSSGSGLFATIGSSHYLIGQLRGGSASCSNPSGSNVYGRFDLAYNAALNQWLNARTKSQGDLNGDGKSDLIWYNASTGMTSAWLMNGTSILSFAALFTDPNWKVIATGDLNGDGKSDLIWYNASARSTGAWLMNGTNVLSFATLFTDPNWKVIATGDLNGDGKSDLIWYSASTGSTAAWLMDGTSMLSNAVLFTDPNRKVIATGDLDGDGKSDLIWYDASTGMTSAWLMNGTSMLSFAALLTNPDWKVIATGDLDGDGKADLIWYNANTGTTGAWLMNGTSMLSFATLFTDPNWKVIGTGDLNGDGKADLIWYNASTGMTAAWLMNGTSVLSFAILLTNPDWKVTGY